jgi:hypothetical protein
LFALDLDESIQDHWATTRDNAQIRPHLIERAGTDYSLVKINGISGSVRFLLLIGIPTINLKISREDEIYLHRKRNKITDLIFFCVVDNNLAL